MKTMATVMTISIMGMTMLFAGCNQNSAPSTQNQTGNAPTNAITPSQGNSTTPPSSSGAQTKLTLENIQITDSAALITTTHGDMQSAYANPQIINGNSKQFIVTFKNIDPGKYALNQPTSIKSNWGTTMLISQTNSDLKLTFQLEPNITTFNTEIGGGEFPQCHGLRYI